MDKEGIDNSKRMRDQRERAKDNIRVGQTWHPMKHYADKGMKPLTIQEVKDGGAILVTSEGRLTHTTLLSHYSQPSTEPLLEHRPASPPTSKRRRTIRRRSKQELNAHQPVVGQVWEVYNPGEKDATTPIVLTEVGEEVISSRRLDKGQSRAMSRGTLRMRYSFVAGSVEAYREMNKPKAPPLAGMQQLANIDIDELAGKIAAAVRPMTAEQTLFLADAIAKSVVHRLSHLEKE